MSGSLFFTFSASVPGVSVGENLTTFSLVPSVSTFLVSSSCLPGFSGVNCSEGWFCIFFLVCFLSLIRLKVKWNKGVFVLFWERNSLNILAFFTVV